MEQMRRFGSRLRILEKRQAVFQFPGYTLYQTKV